MGSNQEQVDYWNGEAAQTWITYQERLDGMLTPVTDALIEQAAVRKGERVIDVGCGCGTTTLALARHGAKVHGIDVSGPMLTQARARLENWMEVDFFQRDATQTVYAPGYDLVLSQFGVMFFADPWAAFTNLRRILVEEGRLAFACWQSPRENPWVTIPMRAIKPFLPEYVSEPGPKAPGPFAFADQDYVYRILKTAGFRSIGLKSFQTNLHLADNLDDAVDFQKQIGPIATTLGALKGARRKEALAALREALAANLTKTGLDLGAACWIVTARRA